MNINFHYYVVKTLAHFAQFENPEDQQKLAYYSQFVDDYFSGNGYPENLLIRKIRKIPGFLYFLSIGAIERTKDKDVFIFKPAFTGFSNLDAFDKWIRLNVLVPFHFITTKPLNQFSVQEVDNDFTVKRCKAADREDGLLINTIMETFINDIMLNRAGKKDEWIIKLGMLLHIYADTFAHEGYSGDSGEENWCSIKECRRVSDNTSVTIHDFFSIFAIGHAEAMHVPDVLDFMYSASRKNGKKEEYLEQRNNKERYEICAKRIYTMLCNICGTPLCENQQWDEIFQRIWEASAQAVDGSNEIYNTEALDSIWTQKFAKDKISYKYPKNNPYFGLDKMEISEIDVESLEAAGYNKEDVYEAGTVRGNHAREYATTIYRPTDAYFLWNEYAYMHRHKVDKASSAEMFLIGVPALKIETKELEKESSSEFVCPEDDQIIVGRYHKGDENGKTQYKYGKIKIVRRLNESSNLKAVGIRLSKTFSSERMKESSSGFLNDNVVIVGRKHSGDENGETSYLYKRVFVESATGMFLPCKAIVSEQYSKTVSVKESDGRWVEYPVTFSEDETVYAAMYGREHHGDENGTTKTYFALFDIDQDAEALTEDEFNNLKE